ncbi:hypothetical protein ASG60_21550 [Methylobacterium sp. Leaf469]|uniref:DUF6531 domain-containing protein n=1 Tax=Methylobacterium sp. Leaf469 TaxID=1736387 RepID=UPI0006FA7ED1|nr:DUF6531 domain-containing protein [Methylobacterium sp. Leaf469]KQT91004.1 hypothetical protein ASG60_21550 [Methylobacterium sp. Leaf469]
MITAGEPDPPPGPNFSRGREGGQPNESVQNGNANGKMVVGGSAAPSETDEQRRRRILNAVRETRTGMGWLSHADPFVRGIANTATNGLSDKLSAGVDALLGSGEGNSLAERYRFNTQVNEAVNQVDAENRPTAQMAGEVLAENLLYERGLRLLKGGERILKRLGRGRKVCKDCSRRPVVLRDGTKVTFDVDFLLHGTLPLDLSRAYASDLDSDGPLGCNRIGSFDETLSAQPDGSLLFVMASGVTADYARPAPNIGEVSVNTHHPAITLAAGPDATFTAREHGVIRLFRRGSDGVWRLAEIRDPNGNAARLVRDAAGLLLRLDRSDGFALLFENDKAGRRSGVTLRAPGGETRPISRYAYDANGNLVEVRNTYARSFRYTYDAEGRFTAYDDGVATRVAYAYDGQDRVISVTTPGGVFDHTLAYEPEARATTLAYARLVGPARTVFDADGNFVARTDGLGRTRTYERDAFGAVVAEIDPAGYRTTYAYDEDGRLERLIDPAGQTWEWSYDGRGNLVLAVDPLGYRTDYATDEAGLLTANMRHDGLIERRDYDAQHNLVRLVDYRGGTTLFERDAFGRLTARTDPLGQVTRFAYDERPCAHFWTPTALTRPDGVTVRREAEPRQATLTLIHGEGRRTLYRYGPFDLLESIEDSKGGRLHLAYDAEERLVRVENQLGRHWTFTRDAAGRVVEETDFSGLTTRFAYDRADRLVEMRHADGAHVAYAYDRTGLPLREEAWTPGAAAPAVTAYRYDACGRLRAAVNADATVEFARDALGRVTAETQNGRRVESTYDCCGNRTERRIGERLVAVAYDPFGALSGIAIGGHVPLRFARDVAGREFLRESAAGFRLEQAWDAVGQLVGQRGGREPSPAGLPPGPGVERTYAWAHDFSPRAIADARWGETTYETDAAGQVVRTRHGDGSEERFAYDAALNLAESGTAEDRLRPWQVAPGGRVERALRRDDPAELRCALAGGGAASGAGRVPAEGLALRPGRARPSGLVRDAIWRGLSVRLRSVRAAGEQAASSGGGGGGLGAGALPGPGAE